MSIFDFLLCKIIFYEVPILCWFMWWSNFQLRIESVECLVQIIFCHFCLFEFLTFLKIFEAKFILTLWHFDILKCRKILGYKWNIFGNKNIVFFVKLHFDIFWHLNVKIWQKCQNVKKCQNVFDNFRWVFLSYSVPIFILVSPIKEKTLQTFFGPKHVLI